MELSQASNWLGAVWMLSNYMTWKGLHRYGFEDEANRIARCSIELLTRDLEVHGELHESYHPDSGAPIINGGFLSWNLLISEMVTSA